MEGSNYSQWDFSAMSPLLLKGVGGIFSNRFNWTAFLNGGSSPKPWPDFFVPRLSGIFSSFISPLKKMERGIHFFSAYWTLCRYAPFPLRKWNVFIGIPLNSASDKSESYDFVRGIFCLPFPSMTYSSCPGK